MLKKWLRCDKKSNYKKYIRNSENSEYSISILEDSSEGELYHFIYVDGRFPDIKFASEIEELTLNNKTKTIEETAFITDLHLIKNGYILDVPFFIEKV